MNTVIHKANTRGYADHGWLKARHTFSFSGYYDPHRVRFGSLRVLNDDIIEASEGFGTHPHDNMEIVTIPISGSLKHEDSMGHSSVIRAGEVQVMSAGTGLQHSEFNASSSDPLNLLQIWIFPQKQEVEPRYDQKYFNESDRLNKFQCIVSEDGRENSLRINQKAFLYRIDLSAGSEEIFRNTLTDNYSYFFIISGDVSIEGHNLSDRDGIGFTSGTEIKLRSNTFSELLILEVPPGK